jgi:formylglycine-generating enzyme required for sulfatase activity/serine/threonine protein kinase
MSTPDKVMTPCPSCGAKLSVPSTAAGKKIRCPKCQTVVAITADMVNQPLEMVAPPAAVPKQVSGPEVSLGGENTFAGAQKKKYAPESLGDQATFGGKLGSDDVVIDDDMEIVDLSARYTIEGTLGKGGMGEVQLATDNRLGRKVAIKRIRGDAGKSRTVVSRFLTEAKSIATLNHANIVQIYDYGRDKTGPFLILEYVDGKSLLDKCFNNPLSVEEAVDLICQVCDGLGKAHDAGIIHRDLKPANVLLTKDGVPKLTDFGLARVETGDTGQTMSGAVLGTLDFMPPEQRRDATQADARSDLWSLAATLYQMVTGKTPKIIKFKDVPQSLQDVLGKALEDAKDDRYQTAREFKEALRASLQNSVPEVADLGEGQCLSCGTKNEGHRKFCKECAVSLRVHCFSCNVEIPVWDKVCSECGTKQAALLESRRHAMTAQQSQAESLLKNYDFDQATSLAVALRDEPDPRLQQLKGWSKLFVEQIETARRQQLERIGTLLSEALQHEQAYDYPSGIHTLQQVPEILRGASIPGQSLTPAKLLKRLTETQAEVHRLDELIRQRVKLRHLNGLQEEVDSLLELCPDRSDLQTLKEQLADRDAKLIATRDEAFAAAQQLLQTQDYAGAIKELERIDPYVLHPKIITLREEAAALQRRLQTLQKTIAAAVEQKQLHGLLKSVEECLLLKAGDAELEALRERLIKRDEKNASQIIGIVEKAEQRRSECQFAEASRALQRIPEELQTQEVLDLMVTCDAMATQRKSAMKALQDSIPSKRYAEGLTTSAVYRNAINHEGLNDSEFETQYQVCQQALDAEHKAKADADRQRSRRLLIGLRIAAATLVLVLACGLIIRSSKRATADRVAKAEADRVAKAEEEVARLEVARLEAARVEELKRLETARVEALQAWANDFGVPVESTNSIGMKLKLIPPGEFMMGSNSSRGGLETAGFVLDDTFDKSDEQPVHRVGITNPFYMGIHEVTRGQFATFVNDTAYQTEAEKDGKGGYGLDAAGNGAQKPEYNWKHNGMSQTDSHPVVNVSWNDAGEFIEWLSKKEGKSYRLPTEAEWEYCCRAGNETHFSSGDSPASLKGFANVMDASYKGKYTNNDDKSYQPFPFDDGFVFGSPVGQFKANTYGLHDMHGNVLEWCSDWYGTDYYATSPLGHPAGATSGSFRVLRGGSWDGPVEYCRSAQRFDEDPSYRYYSLGFRLALSADFVTARSLSPAADGQVPTPERLPSEMPEVPNLLASSEETSEGESSAKFPALIGPGQPIAGTQRSAQGGGSQMLEPIEAGGASKLGGVGGPGDTTFMDVSAIGKTFVYVIDTSSSMSGGRLKLAQSQLKKSLRLLQPNQQFGVIFYNENRAPLMLPRQGDRVMHYATESNKLAASHSIDRIRSDAGTEHKAALLEALRLKSDVIYFLTDGDEPELSPADLREIAKQTGKTTIHVIKFGDSAVESRPMSWLEKLAAQSYGEYRPITE